MATTLKDLTLSEAKEILGDIKTATLFAYNWNVTKDQIEEILFDVQELTDLGWTPYSAIHAAVKMQWKAMAERAEQNLIFAAMQDEQEKRSNNNKTEKRAI